MGGGNALYLAQTHKFQSHESTSQKSIILGRFSPHSVIKALKMLGQFGKNKSAQSANPSYAVIARFGNAESWQSKLSVIARALPEAIQKIKSFCFVWLSQNEESPYPIDSNPQSEILPIRSWLIYFAYCFNSRALDTSLRNATLSMTKFLPYHDKTKSPVILSLCKRRSIHFGDLRILCDSLTLSESMRLNFTRFAHFGLLRRRFTRFAHDSPTNPKANQKRFNANQRTNLGDS